MAKAVLNLVGAIRAKARAYGVEKPADISEMYRLIEAERERSAGLHAELVSLIEMAEAAAAKNDREVAMRCYRAAIDAAVRAGDAQ